MDFTELHDNFVEKKGDKRDDMNLLDSLNTINKNGNETWEEFNKRFNELIKSFPTKIKPPQKLLLFITYNPLVLKRDVN